MNDMTMINDSKVRQLSNCARSPCVAKRSERDIRHSKAFECLIGLLMYFSSRYPGQKMRTEKIKIERCCLIEVP